MLFCAGCASTPVVRTDTVQVKVPVIVPIPAKLTAPVPQPELQGDTNADLAALILACRAAIDRANDKLKAIEAASH